MPNVTEAQRVQRIKDLLAQLNKQPPERHEVANVPLPGESRLCQVITISVDEVVLNPYSHRVRAQLQDDPDWNEFKSDPYGEPAQRVVQRHVREARKPEQFAALQDSLAMEGQTDPGVITSKGVLINANTRAVALRELSDPAKRYIRVAVLPETMQPAELALVELRLQMQKQLKVEYTLTNELLFIEELSIERHLSDEQIAKELRIGKTPKAGGTEVALRLRCLDLLRTLQQVPAAGLPLTFFDDKLGYEHLYSLERAHSAVSHDPAAADRVLDAFLFSVCVGVTQVHQLRKIDPDFISDYMLPQLDPDDLLEGQVALLANAVSSSASPLPTGVGALLGASDDTPQVDVRALIDVVTQRSHRVKVPGTDIVLDQPDVKETFKDAIVAGVKEKGRDDKSTDRLEAPGERMRAASQAVEKCREACKGVASTEDFGDRRRKSLEVKFKALRKSVQLLEADLVEAGVLKK